MTHDINNFISIERQKNGKIKITHDIVNEGNIYKLLRDFGFRKDPNRRRYFRMINNDLVPVKFFELKDAFKESIKLNQFKCLQDDICSNDILEWYYSKNPIRQNGLSDHILSETLTEYDLHKLKLNEDCVYRHKIEMENILSAFYELGFSKTSDLVNSYSRYNGPLYYKAISTGRYLIFNHWNANSKLKDGFDTWTATYKNVNEIGKCKPITLQAIYGTRISKDSIKSLLSPENVQ